MTTERHVRMVSGAFILISLLLAYLHSRYWLWLTAVVGLALLQSAFTCFCPLERLLKKFCGCGCGCGSSDSGSTSGAKGDKGSSASGDQGSCCLHKPD